MVKTEKAQRCGRGIRGSCDDCRGAVQNHTENVISTGAQGKE
jgi:hypothetical protein